jgi:hypothetical protein
MLQAYGSYRFLILNQLTQHKIRKEENTFYFRQMVLQTSAGRRKGKKMKKRITTSGKKACHWF